MTTLHVEVVGVGAWSPGLEGWPALRAALCRPEATDDASSSASRPSPALLPPAERRRAPVGVAVALEVAREAVAAAAADIDTESIASVFASAHGDLAIVDYLCETLATDPLALSPTRFHLSVHNAAAGYWSIATRDRAATNAIAAGDDSFALGLVEAATLAVAEGRPVLLVAFDTPAVGLLLHAVANTALFGFALVVRPVAGHADVALSLTIEPGEAERPAPRHRALSSLAATSPAAQALALAEALAASDDVVLRYPLSRATALSVAVRRTDGT